MSILPGHKSKFDKKFDELIGLRLESIDVGVINTLADSCPANLLPILALSFDIDIGEFSEDAARGIIKEAFEIHRKSGTAYAVRKAVRAIDSDALVVEGNLSQRYNESLRYDGSRFYGSNTHWAEYSIITSKQTDIETANRIKAAAQRVAPVRCLLTAVESRPAPPLHNGTIYYDQKYNYGVY